MTTTPSLPQLSDRLFDRLSVYQDVVLAGQTVRRGVRDCEARWELIAPYLSAAGSVLDVGSNFGWFGLRICQEHPDCVLASVEADERSGAVQREVLRSHAHARICLLTGRAGRRLAARFAAAGQRFDAALCLSLLHWLPDHRQFLTGLGGIAARLFVELPDPRESGVGVERLRREIGEIGPYLRACFPDRAVRCLGATTNQTANHRPPGLPREMWLVDRPAAWTRLSEARGRVSESHGHVRTSPGLEVAALAELSISWPPRSWWEAQLAGLEVPPADSPPRRVLFAPHGLRLASQDDSPPDDLPPLAVTYSSLERLRRRVRKVPEHGLLSRSQWLHRRLKKAAAAVLHGPARWMASIRR